MATNDNVLERGTTMHYMLLALKFCKGPASYADLEYLCTSINADNRRDLMNALVANGYARMATTTGDTCAMYQITPLGVERVYELAGSDK